METTNPSYLPLVEHANLVRHAPDGREAMRHYQGRSPLRHSLQRRLHQMLTLAVQRTVVNVVRFGGAGSGWVAI